MPAIPTYDVSTSVDTQPRVHIPTANGASPIGSALGDVGRGISVAGADLQQQMRVRQAAEQKQADERAKVWAGEQAGQSLLTETQTLDDMQRKAPPGADGFAKSYLEGFDTRAAAAVAAAPDDASKRYLQQHVTAQRTHLGAVAQDFQFKAGDADVVNRYTNSAETWGKVIDQDPTQFGAAMNVLTTTMPAVVPQVREKLLDHAKTTLTNSAAASVMNQVPTTAADGTTQGGPYAVRDATNKALGAGGFTGPTGVPWVDAAKPAQIKTWNDAAQVKIHQIEGNAARNADAAEKLAAQTYTSAADLSAKGQYFDPAFQFRLLNETRGTSFEEQATKLIDDQRNTAGFATGTATQRAVTLDTMRGPGGDPTKGTNPDDAKQLAKFQTIDSAITAAVTKNPWEAATQYGVLKSAPVTPITSADGALKVADARLAAIGPMESWTGKKESPFQPEEAAQIAGLVAKLPAPQASSFLGQLGARIGDSDRTAAFARQINDKDGTLGLAMSLANTQTTEGRYASELVLTGNQMIRDGAIKVDGTKETGWKAEIAKQVRGAYANREVEDQVVKAAFLIAGAKDGDIDNAVRLATGGGVIDFNGSKVPMPNGYAASGGQSGAEDKFRAAIAALPPEQLMPQAPDGKVYARGVPMAASAFLQSLPQAQLVMAGKNRNGGNSYAVKAGNTLVTNVNGRPILIQLQ